MKSYRIAVLWRGDRGARNSATPQNNRFHRIFEELVSLGIEAEAAVYDEAFIDEVREQLLLVDGVLVWVDPISQGRTRAALDPMLRDVAARGPWVSAHPDTILKMGTKEVLHRTKHLGWGTDTRLYRTRDEFRTGFPASLQSAGPRVLKQNRGNDGRGVWKVEAIARPGARANTLRVLEAMRGSVPNELPLPDFMTRCEAYFEAGGCIVDQPFQPRLPEGMIRCYMGNRQGRRLRSPIHQGADPAATRGAGLPGGAARPAHHARPRCGAVSGAARENGAGVGAANDATPRPRRRLAADHLGRRFSVRAAHRLGRGHVCVVRDQCQLLFRHSRSGAGGDCPPCAGTIARHATELTRPRHPGRESGNGGGHGPQVSG